MTTAHKWVYSFGDGKAEGTAEMRNLLGGKGAGLAEMNNLGLPVPPGFTITTEVCTHYYENEKSYPEELKSQVIAALAGIETTVGAKFGDASNPLLVSVRSGARASMPGMMDTILNLGLNDATVKGLVVRSGDARFAYDSYRRFIQMYGSVVLEIQMHKFESIMDDMKLSQGVTQDTALTAEDWQEVIAQYFAVVEKETGKPFPQKVEDQLWGAIGAVFGSWMNQRAITYRRLNDIPASWGTAVNVQAMVFGNMGEDCCTGVAFTRNPSTGENAFYGEYLVNAQGEDVVAGIRTPQHLTVKGKEDNDSHLPAMEEVMPEVFAQFNDVRLRLEKHYRDMQDLEFTVQQGKLYMLQTRTGKRTAPAAIRIAVEMVKEGLISKEEAVKRIDPAALDQLLHPMLDPKATRNMLAKGLPASPGAASGVAVFTADEAEAMAQTGQRVILCRVETSPEDIHGMAASAGIVTSRGGMTSHAAVVARGMGRACVAGAGEIHMDYTKKEMVSRGVTIKQGETITIDGSAGEIMVGKMPTIQPQLSGDFAELMSWADEFRTLKVRANAETSLDTNTALKFGAEGIGLCRTEHMFFDEERIVAVREMIVATDEKGRRAALDKLLPMQQKDFEEIFSIMDGLPVTIRLLDPPLHEFLPKTESEIAAVAAAAGVSVDVVSRRASMLHEANPMLGHRGCRLGITYPEIYEMQARAIFGAVIAMKQAGKTVLPEVMIPLISVKAELDRLEQMVRSIANEMMKSAGVEFEYLVGTMIELPRAALQAGEIAKTAEFFSFGTNDLTQTTFGLSRDDAGNFLPDYVRAGVLDQDPFVTLDQDGVGELVKIATERGRATRSNIKLGICGEHGGDPASVKFCHAVGLNYVSCSPYRVPIARLAAAQAAIETAKDRLAKQEAA
ncbi:MAG: pyruvate, phosphate dikinase [Bdellovibrionales bacterium]